MDIMTIIAKAADGQTLTDEERTALKAYKAPDTKAYEAELSDLRAKLAIAAGDKDKGATEVAQLRKQVDSLTKGLEEERAVRCDQYHIAGGGVNSLPNYTKAPLKGIQDCLTNATPTSVVPVFMAGVGGNTWGTNYGIAMFASSAQFGDEHGFSQNLALRVKTNQTTARNVTTDGLLPFWPRFNFNVVNNANVDDRGHAFVGCPVWYVNFNGIANRTL